MTLLEHILATCFALRASLAAAAARARTEQDAIVQVWSYVGRLARRFERLYERWRTNTLPTPRPKPENAPRRTRTPRPRLSRRWAWLLRHDNNMGNHASGIALRLSQPDAAQFLAEVPRAAAMVRPLLHMLGISTQQTPLYKAPPARKPRPPKPRPEPVARGKYPRFNPYTYSPGKMPPLKKPAP